MPTSKWLGGWEVCIFVGQADSRREPWRNRRTFRATSSHSEATFTPKETFSAFHPTKSPRLALHPYSPQDRPRRSLEHPEHRGRLQRGRLRTGRRGAFSDPRLQDAGRRQARWRGGCGLRGCAKASGDGPKGEVQKTSSEPCQKFTDSFVGFIWTLVVAGLSFSPSLSRVGAFASQDICN